MSRTVALGLTAVVAVVVSMGACKKKDLVGVGPYRFGETNLAEAEKAGRCIPVPDEPDMLQCLGMPGAGLGGTENIFFSRKTTLLAEIEISLPSCNPVGKAQELENSLGKPESKTPDGRRVIWALDRMFVIARLPLEGSQECLINFVANEDKARIAKLRSGQ
jgi:hypothetical protein